MPKLPVCSGRQAIRAFEKLGWTIHRDKSSHVSMHQPGNPILLVVPDHKELDTGMLRSLIRDASITVERFIELLRK
jgi:predicted RNA binding protein YcfA (HicA-like mRNA interferase family)